MTNETSARSHQGTSCLRDRRGTKVVTATFSLAALRLSSKPMCGSWSESSVANDLDALPERHPIRHQFPRERPWLPVLERGVERDI